MRVWMFSCLMLGMLAACSENEPLQHQDQTATHPVSGLETIKIETSESINNKKKKPAFFTFISPTGDTVFYDAHGKIKTRGEGHGALKFEKSSYTIKMSTAFAPEGMKADKDWILNAAYIDKSLMRTKIAYDLYRKMNPENIAPQTNWVHLYFNEEYQGIYLLHEKMDETRMHVVKTDSSARIFKAPRIFLDGDLAAYADSIPNFFDQRFPDVEARNVNEEMKAFRDFIHFSADADFLDEKEGLASKIDIDNVIDWHLLLIMTNNTTGVLKNNYLYKQQKGSKWRIAVWDADRGFGRDGDNELNLDGFIDIDRNKMLHRLMQLNAFGYNDRLRRRYEQLKADGILSAEGIRQQISEADKVLAAHAPANFERWPADGPYYFDDSTYTQEVNLMKDWIGKRVPKVEAYISEAGK